MNTSYKQTFNTNGVIFIPNMIENFEQYQSIVQKQSGMVSYSKQQNQYLLDEKEPEVEGSFSRNYFPHYQELYYNVKKRIEKILEMRLYTTYYFDRFYFAGQKLNAHTDDPEREITVSIQISTNKKEPWDLWFTNYMGKDEKFSMSNGDACIYNGCRILHWRLPLETRYNKYQRWYRKMRKLDDDTYHHQLCFHYVNADGPFMEHAFNLRF